MASEVWTVWAQLSDAELGRHRTKLKEQGKFVYGSILHTLEKSKIECDDNYVKQKHSVNAKLEVLLRTVTTIYKRYLDEIDSAHDTEKRRLDKIEKQMKEEQTALEEYTDKTSRPEYIAQADHHAWKLMNTQKNFDELKYRNITVVEVKRENLRLVKAVECIGKEWCSITLFNTQRRERVRRPFEGSLLNAPQRNGLDRPKQQAPSVFPPLKVQNRTTPFTDSQVIESKGVFPPLPVTSQLNATYRRTDSQTGASSPIHYDSKLSSSAETDSNHPLTACAGEFPGAPSRTFPPRPPNESKKSHNRRSSRRLSGTSGSSSDDSMHQEEVCSLPSWVEYKKVGAYTADVTPAQSNLTSPVSIAMLNDTTGVILDGCSLKFLGENSTVMKVIDIDCDPDGARASTFLDLTILLNNDIIVSDSLGKLWRVPHGQDHAEVFMEIDNMKPTGITNAGNHLYVIDSKNGRVMKIDIVTKAFVCEIALTTRPQGGVSSEGNRSEKPRFISVNRNGWLLVTDTLTCHVYCYTSEGTLVKGKEFPATKIPTGVCWVDDSRFVVALRGNNSKSLKLCLSSMEDNTIDKELGPEGQGQDGSYRPLGMDTWGNYILVCDQSNSRIVAANIADFDNVDATN